MARKKIKIGDRIRFRAVTRWSDKPATRKVVDIDQEGRPLVRFGGWSNFIVERNEVLEVLPA